MKREAMTRRGALRMLGTGAVALATGRLDVTLRAAEPKPAMPLLAHAIPATKENLPVIGLGTWQTFDVGANESEQTPLAAVLGEFAALGGKLIDSSPMYGRSETVAGELMARLGLRGKLFVATKVWTSGKREGIEQMEDSMRKLRASPIDLLQVHNLVDAGTHLETLRGWKRDGRVRYVGVTHYTASGADAVARLVAAEIVDFVQINYSVGEREAEKRLFPLARERGIAVIANRPFAGGDLFSRLRRRPLPSWAAEIDCESWAQILLKFVVSHPAVTCAIPATSKLEHLRDNMKAGAGRMPDASLRAKIAALEV